MHEKFLELMVNVVLLVLAPVITTAVATLTFVVRDWRLRRDANGRKAKAIDQAMKQVTFLDVWLSAYGKAPEGERDGGLERRVVHDLEQTYETVAAAAAQPIPERVGVREALRALLRVLLLRPVHSYGANLVRTVYYIVLPFSLFAIAGIGSGIVDAATYDGLRGGVAAAVFLIAVISVVCLLPAALLWSLTRFLDRRYRSRPAYVS